MRNLAVCIVFSCLNHLSRLFSTKTSTPFGTLFMRSVSIVKISQYTEVLIALTYCRRSRFLALQAQSLPPTFCTTMVTITGFLNWLGLTGALTLVRILKFLLMPLQPLLGIMTPSNTLKPVVQTGLIQKRAIPLTLR